MEISYQALLKKMEEKINQARQESSDSKVREHIQAIKTLCEVILDEPAQTKPATVEPPPVYHQTPPVQVTPTYRPMTTTSLGEKKLETDDGANGDSLFDF